ncbi:hypothetical protein, partial [Gluconobacter oxydans]|uniref:hypothetical protein n=1 Tax=Gluconobacter oxydans TaxID=442 RepID=UPI0039EAEF54
EVRPCEGTSFLPVLEALILQPFRTTENPARNGRVFLWLISEGISLILNKRTENAPCYRF